MKKIYFILVFSLICCLLSTGAMAQQKSNDWNIDVGVNAAAPIRNLYYFTSFGFGVDGAVTTKLTDQIAVGGRANYSYFIGKSSFFGTEAHGASVFNVLADGSYTLPQNIFLGVDLGVGFEATNGQSDTEFARIFNLGYKWDQSKQHTYIFTIYFDQTTYEKCLGLRAAIRL